MITISQLRAQLFGAGPVTVPDVNPSHVVRHEQMGIETVHDMTIRMALMQEPGGSLGGLEHLCSTLGVGLDNSRDAVDKPHGRRTA